MAFILYGIGLIAASGFLCLFIRNGRICTRIGAAGVLAGSLLGLYGAGYVLLSGTILSLDLPWQVPYGAFHIELDRLSSLFLMPLFVVCSVAAVYGCGYMAAYKDRRLGVPAFFFNLLTAAMAMVVLARNSILFLVSWEVMTLASYFLVTFEDEHRSVRQAGWVYLIAAHIGTAFLLAFFVLLGKYNNNWDFAGVDVGDRQAAILFLLALVGFGTKAGLMPLHVWLPEAHPAAPSPVSAVMSGVMLKMGIYGIVRTISVLPDVQIEWGWLLTGLGILSGVLGILFAAAQHDIKRMLAYSSIENIGIILIGLGLGIVGMAGQSPALTVLGFSAALLHTVNHALFKSLLFMGAGSVVHATGTRLIDVLGGLIKKMPFTATGFALGAAAICALPPLNGFISEFLLYYGSFKAVLSERIEIVVPAAAAIAALAAIGGFALAAFAKVFGIVFLGLPRSQRAQVAHESPLSMTAPMGVLALLCVMASAAAPWLFSSIACVVSSAGFSKAADDPIPAARPMLYSIAAASILLLMLAAGAALLRWKILRGRTTAEEQTWGCGFAAPTSRMQYTGSSFAQPIVDMFRAVLGSRRKVVRITEFFPRQAEFETHTPDVSSEYLYRPIFKWVDWFIGKMRWVQYGIVQVYVLYIALTLMILLIWKLR
ncbi:MAG TPA: proton-conducting transporter membrane subunit [Anaerohalosphaeraceae bacterium]|nr:proton-conducting transporter membrane subunit [Anaerohalosphaeraceae bacterium]HPC64150.1 proton-conducting transporter membrane subunit [Anaerohalosphaeraceae bacterium]HPO69872.1 proton-conducting transporter membrane subunit [Anaerohalosphaeraceae bacterium]HRS71725.1 proton-conducting transporter membrane subunit [Anaerohalosphaeraceae bacterium]HRV20467.1 proton-conducting transporter membrane subunit [Anaerohalosphaeraceae bacterium]